MARFGMVVAISGAGKTTFAHQHEDDWFIVDSDEVRQHLFNDATVQDKNAQVFDYMFRVTQACLTKNIDVLYVATNLSMKRRATLVKQLKNRFPDLTCHCFVLNATIEECYQRNAERHRTVPSWVIDRQLRNFQFPFYSEGWDSIEIVNNSDVPANTAREEWLEKLKTFGSQDNPHHTLSLYDHSKMVSENLAYTKDVELMEVGLYHDVGKILTKTYDNEGVAHYYNHQNVGAYIAMNCGLSVRACQLICAHMEPFNPQSRGANRYGEHFWHVVQQLHEADITAK